MNKLLIALTFILLLIIFVFCRLVKADAYKISFYCACKKCCGKNAKGVTASGLPAKEGMIAVDPMIVPLNTFVEIQGLGKFLSADTGSAIKGKCIDVFCKSHKIAMQRGILYREVKILTGGETKENDNE